MSIVASLQMGNVLFADHQSYCPGQFELWRNGDCLLVNANAPAPGGGNNQYAQRKSPWGNTVNISSLRKIGVGDGIVKVFQVPTDLSFVPKSWRFWTFDKGLWSDSPIAFTELAPGIITTTTPPPAGTEVFADFSEGLQSYPESMSSNYGTGVLDLAYEVTPEYVYKAGDFKCAYQQQQSNGNVCTELTRQMVYLRPNIWVFYDRVTTTKPDFVKQVRWHMLGTVPAAAIQNEFSATVNKSFLCGQAFSPDPIKTELATVLNSGQDGPKPVQRISVSLAKPAAKARYLTVLQALDLTTVPMQVTYDPITESVMIANSSVAFFREGIPGMSYSKV